MEPLVCSAPGTRVDCPVCWCSIACPDRPAWLSTGRTERLVLCWSEARTGRSRSDSSSFRGSDVVHDLRWAAVFCIDGVAALGAHDLRKLVELGVATGREDDGSGDSGFHRLATGDECLDGLNFPTSGLVGLAAAASRALLAFTIDWTNPRPLRRLILGVGSLSFGG